MISLLQNLTQDGSLVSATLSQYRSFSWIMAASAGLIDGVNVCALHIILILLGGLFFLKDRKRALLMGLTFLWTIFVSYVFFGLFFASYLSAFVTSENYSRYSQNAELVIIAIVGFFALLNLIEFFWPKLPLVSLSGWEESFLGKMINKMDLPTAALSGFIAALFLLPCSLPIYLSAVGILAHTFTLGALALHVIIYSLMFILPAFIILSLALRAETFLRHAEFHSDKYKWLHLVKGGILILGAILIYIF